jgi:peroxiredoxin
VPGKVWALAAIGLLFGGWQAVSIGVRAYVDERIERQVGGEVVDFALRDLDGASWRAADLRGRALVLHFFRSKCVSCFAERDTIRELEQRLDPERVVLLGVLLDAVQGYSAETTAETLARLDYHHPILVADADFVDAFHGAGWSHVTPVTYVVDPAGRIVRSVRGRLEIEAIAADLPEGALAERPAGAR